MVFGMVAVAIRGDLFSAGSGGKAVMATAIAALGSGAAALSILAVVNTTARIIVWPLCALLALGTAITAWIAIGAATDDADVSSSFDSNGATIYAVTGAVCGIVALISVLAIPARTLPGRSWTSALIAGLVVLVAVPTSVVVAHGYAHPWKSNTVAPQAVPPYPDQLGSVDYRLRLPAFDLDHNFVTAGTGFVVADGTVVRAFDGITGQPRWSFDFADIGRTHADRRPALTVTQDGVVEAVASGVRVGLDSVTGEIRRRSPSSDTQSRTGNCGTGTTRTVVAECSDGVLRLTNRADGHDTTLPQPLPAGEVLRVTALDDDHLAFLIAPTGTSDVTDVIVTDGALTRVDEFRAPGELPYAAPGPTGTLALTSNSLGDRRIVIRSFRSHHTQIHTLSRTVYPELITTVGDLFVVVPDYDELTTIDPATGTMETATTPPCSPDRYGNPELIMRVVPAPGAVLVLCRRRDDALEVVGLRE